jgi:hypothetical protein
MNLRPGLIGASPGLSRSAEGFVSGVGGTNLHDLYFEIVAKRNLLTM